jgi:hypothetical protein
MFSSWVLTRIGSKRKTLYSIFPVRGYRVLIHAIWSLVAVFASTGAYSQDDKNFPPPSAENIPVVTAKRTQERLKIDGKLDEVDWRGADIIDDFFKFAIDL